MPPPDPDLAELRAELARRAKRRSVLTEMFARVSILVGVAGLGFALAMIVSALTGGRS